MNNIETITIEDGGKITLPVDVLERYGFEESTPIRLIKTSNGVLLVPLTDEPMNTELTAELKEWQALGEESFEMFPYEEKYQ